jgi:hypothetical protein
MSREAEATEVSTTASTLDPLKPFMLLTEAIQWLHNFFDHEPPFVPGDDLGTCFCSYAAVMLSALVVGTESPVILAGVTSYPAPFVAAVLNSMRPANAWGLESVLALKTLLKETPTDWVETQVVLNDAMEGVWHAVCTPGAQIALESLRQRVLFGGETQRWLDADAVEFFDLA